MIRHDREFRSRDAELEERKRRFELGEKKINDKDTQLAGVTI